MLVVLCKHGLPIDYQEIRNNHELAVVYIIDSAVLKKCGAMKAPTTKIGTLEYQGRKVTGHPRNPGVTLVLLVHCPNGVAITKI